MKNRIGVLDINDDFEQGSTSNLLINKFFDMQSYSLIEVKEKKQLEIMDGLVIFLEKVSDCAKVFQLLIDLEENISLFIWIVSKEKDSELVNLYPHLSKNSVIEIVELDQDYEELAIII